MCRLRKAHRHPELTEQTIWEVFEAERPKLVPYAGRFDGFRRSRRFVRCASTTTSTRSQPPVGRTAEVQTYADRIAIRQTGASLPSTRDASVAAPALSHTYPHRSPPNLLRLKSLSPFRVMTEHE